MTVRRRKKSRAPFGRFSGPGGVIGSPTANAAAWSQHSILERAKGAQLFEKQGGGLQTPAPPWDI
jgi:hypothetical protein